MDNKNRNKIIKLESYEEYELDDMINEVIYNANKNIFTVKHYKMRDVVDGKFIAYIIFENRKTMH